MQPSQQHLDTLSNEPCVCLKLLCRQLLYWRTKGAAGCGAWERGQRRVRWRVRLQPLQGRQCAAHDVLQCSRPPFEDVNDT